MRLRALLAVPVAVLLMLGLAEPAGAVTSTVRVGRVAVHQCDIGVGAWCGSVKVPLDYTDANAGTIRIGFGWIPAAHPDGTVVAQEGGPGYPSTGTAPDYVDMLGSLLQNRSLLVVDARGTGRSEAIDCEPLQSLPSPSPRFGAAVAECGHQLNHTYRDSAGNWVHASDLFTTANSARDLARVLAALQLGKVDLYGDSYGTYFAQAFLSRYSSLLRSVVLDSAYEARDLDPWYVTTVTTARAAFDKVCQRAIGCASGSSWQRIAQLARSLRAQPVTGRVVGTDNAVHTVTVDITALVNIVNDAGYDTDPYRQLDAAARAYLNHKDPTPLLRLYAQDIGYDYSDYSARAGYYSDGLYMTVACADYPQLFDMRSSKAQRTKQLDRSIAALPKDTFAPFTTREWLSMLPYTETYTGCLNWPAPTHAADPPVPAGVPMDASNVPVLILNGELDSLTPAAGGAHIARQIGPAAHAYVAANNVHLVALDDAYPCGARVVQRFFAHPRQKLNTSCLQQIPAIRAVPSYPATLPEVRPATGSGPTWLRRLASVATGEALDAVVRFNYVDGYRDLGLRGGSVRYDQDGNPGLHDVRYTADTRVTGTGRALAPGGGTATLTVTSTKHIATFHLQWQARGPVTWRLVS